MAAATTAGVKLLNVRRRLQVHWHERDQTGCWRVICVCEVLGGGLRLGGGLCLGGCSRAAPPHAQALLPYISVWLVHHHPTNLLATVPSS